MRLRRVELYDDIGHVQKQIVKLLVLERKTDSAEAKAAIEKRVAIWTERLDELMECL